MASLWANVTSLLWHPTTSSTSCSTTLASTLTSSTSSSTPFHSWIPTTTSCTTSSLVSSGTTSSTRVSFTSSASWTTSTCTTSTAPPVQSSQATVLGTSSSVASFSPSSPGETSTFGGSDTTPLHSTVEGTPLTSSTSTSRSSSPPASPGSAVGGSGTHAHGQPSTTSIWTSSNAPLVQPSPGSGLGASSSIVPGSASSISNTAIASESTTPSLHSTPDGSMPTKSTSSLSTSSSLGQTGNVGTTSATHTFGESSVTPGWPSSNASPAPPLSESSFRSSSPSGLPASDSTSKLPSASGGTTASSPGSVADSLPSGVPASSISAFATPGSASTTGSSEISSGATTASHGSLTDSSRLPSATGSQFDSPSIVLPGTSSIIVSSATSAQDTVTSSRPSSTALPFTSSDGVTGSWTSSGSTGIPIVPVPSSRSTLSSQTSGDNSLQSTHSTSSIFGSSSSAISATSVTSEGSTGPTQSTYTSAVASPGTPSPTNTLFNPSTSNRSGESRTSRGSLTTVPSRPTPSGLSSSASTGTSTSGSSSMYRSEGMSASSATSSTGNGAPDQSIVSVRPTLPPIGSSAGTLRFTNTFSSSAVAPSAETSSGIPNFTLSRTTTSSGLSLPPFSLGLPSPGSSAPPPGFSLSVPHSNPSSPGFSLPPPGFTLPSPVPASTTALTLLPPPITLPPTGPSPFGLPPPFGTSTTSSTSDDRFFWWSSTMFTYTGTTTFPPLPPPTGTITDPPAAVSTEIVPSLSKNQWYTTIKGGKHTVVPVIWCKKCGGGVIIWNLWPIPRNINIDFHIQFPNLPIFKIQCFKIFGIRIWGDCDNPVTVDDDPGDGKKPPPPQSKPTNDPKSTAKSTSKDQSSSQSSSESSCTASMVTNTAVTCVPTTTGTRTTFSCSTSMSAFSGCTVTGTATTTTKSATPTPSWESSFCDADGACGGECPASEEPQNKKRAWGDFIDFDKAMATSWDRAAVRVRHRVSDGRTLNGLDGNPMPARSVHKRWEWPPLDPAKPNREDIRFWLRARHAAAENGERVAPYGVSSDGWVPFTDEYVDMAVQGLYGCTSIIIVSRRGAWMSHIFEVPTITLEDFWIDLDPAIFYGDGKFLQGLNYLTQPGRIFDPASRADDDFEIFIMTPDDSPRRRGAPREWWGDGVVQYPQQVAELKSLMNRRFGVDPTVYAYYRLRPAMSDEESNWDVGIASKADLANLWKTTSSGHYYLEYDPVAEEDKSDQDEDTPMTDEDGNECKKYKAGYRLWVDSYKNPSWHGKPYAQKTWTPLEHQVYESDSEMGSDSDNSDNSDMMALYSNKASNQTFKYFSKAGNKTSACSRKPKQELCAWETCIKSCVPRSGPARSAIIARAFSSVGSWLSNQLNSLQSRWLWASRAKLPEDYLSYANFMVAECRAATVSLQLDGGDLGDGYGMRGLSSSRVVSFEDKPAFNFVLENLFGCTSLVVISRKGFWISHFWEDKNFGNEELFQKEILEQMWTGRDGTYVGLNDYKKPGGILDPNDGVQILLLGPRAYPSTLEQFQTGVWPAELDPRHIGKWQRIISSLKGTWPNSNIQLAGYVPLRTAKLWSVVQQANVVSPLTKEHRWTLFATREYGKILIQWDPKMIKANEQCDRDFAGYRVWADTPYPHLVDSWDKNGLSPGETKSRRDGACSVPPVSTWNTAATAAAPPISLSTTVPYDSGATSWTYTNEPTPSNRNSTTSTRTTGSVTSSSRNSTSSTSSSTITSSKAISTSSKFSFAPSTTSKRPSPATTPKTTAPPKPVSCIVEDLDKSQAFCTCDRSVIALATTRNDKKNGDTSFDCPLRETTVSGAAVVHPTWAMGQEGLSTGAWGISVPYRRFCRRGTMGGTLVTRKDGEMRRTFDCIVEGATMTAIGSSPGKPKLNNGG